MADNKTTSFGKALLELITTLWTVALSLVSAVLVGLLRAGISSLIMLYPFNYVLKYCGVKAVSFMVLWMGVFFLYNLGYVFKYTDE